MLKKVSKDGHAGKTSDARETHEKFVTAELVLISAGRFPNFPLHGFTTGEKSGGNRELQLDQVWLPLIANLPVNANSFHP